MGRMVEQTGLRERLRQHSRHSGMLVGVSMAVVIALTIGAFVWIFFRLDPYLTDVTGRAGAQRASPIARVAPPSRVAASPAGAGTPAPQVVVPPTLLPQAPTPTALSLPSPTPTAGFAATHEVADYGQRVNLRAGPTVTSSRIALLAPGTKLKFLNEETQAGDVTWMKFQTERGDVGWMRDIDVRPLR